MLSSDSIRGYNDAMILTVLARGDSYGYQIAKQIAANSQDTYSMRETTLYSVLTRLVKDGLIEAYPGEISYGRPRTYYHVTASGHQYLADKKTEWQELKTVVDRFLMEE
ncbi:PadR family transcriptional regulator [Lacticaseibacillus mingshuiensis]|uniref:PadR family transcriptional regulator n=1 Tax=Lacticaseibacillus mingshuiensis TaxID=2799574 RepID=A0ABW4CMK3_9LACO|nr:PadR family transcriptional regulator [Lacticaseibacillus mingshuiensis]